MNDALDIAPGVRLPLSTVTQRVAILGISGAGKTYSALKLAEQLLARRQQVVVLDPGGVAWGLRAGADGDPAGGVPVVILGGEHGDLPLEPDAGAAIADLVIDEGLSLVLDLSDFESDAAQQRFATAFAQRLYRRKARNREPLHLIIDEADEFAPQRAMPEQQRMLGAFQTLARRGRQRGVGCTFVTQRPAEFHKSCLTQCSVLVALRMMGAQDVKAIDDWIRHHHADEHRAALMESIAALADGEAWFWSPPAKLFLRARVAARATFDSSHTPEPGRRVREPRGLADVDLDALQRRMAATVERSREADPEYWRVRVRSAEHAAKVAQDAAKEVIDGRVRTDRIDRGELVAAVDRAGRSVELLGARLTAAREQAGAATDRLRDANARLAEIGMEIGALGEHVAALRKVLSKESGGARAGAAEPPRGRQMELAAREGVRSAPRPRGAGADGQVHAGARRMLAALRGAHPRGLTRLHLGVRSVIWQTGGTFSTYLGDLRRKNLVADQEDRLVLTDAGLGESSDTGLDEEALRAAWSNQLDAGARRMLAVLANRYPAHLRRDELADAAEIAKTGGTFSTYLGHLRRAGLVETAADGQLRASVALFSRSP